MALAACAGAGAEELDVNGNFEKKARALNMDTLLNKGFVLGFDEFDWIDGGWVVNPMAYRGYLNFILTDELPGCKRYLKVHGYGGVHVYREAMLPADSNYKVSFMARAEDGKQGTLSVCVYEFGHAGEFKKTRTVKSFKLEKDWRRFECEIPAAKEYKNMRLMFDFNGSCAIADIKLERQ